MKVKSSFTVKHSVWGKWLFAGLIVSFIGPAIAHASLILSAQAATADPGSSGNGFDVVLSNTGPSAVTIAAFSFGVLTANTEISFTDANTSTATAYIFGANSLFGPDLTGPVSGQSLATSDVFAIPLDGASLAAGTGLGLGHIVFDVSASAGPGIFPVTLAAFPTSSLSDPTGANVDIQTFSPGEITITGAVVPEPSTLLMLLGGAALILGRAGRLRASRRSQWVRGQDRA